MSNPFERMARADLAVIESALSRELNHVAGVYTWMHTQLPPSPARDASIREVRVRETQIRTLLIRAIEAGSDPKPKNDQPPTKSA